MTQVVATVEQAVHWVSRSSAPDRSWNPVYQALVGGSAPTPLSPPMDVPGESSLALVLRQLTAPALLMAAVTDRERTHRLRIGLAPTTSTVERSDGEQPSRWSEVSTREVPARVTGLLEAAGVRLAPAQLSIARGTDALRLSPCQHRATYAAILRGLPPAEALTVSPDLDDTLRDALTATGPRIALSLTLHDPRGRVTEQPLTWSRLWVTGGKGLYRLDRPSNPALAVHPVGAGDVLGTLLPVLEQGLRFATACALPGGVR